MPSPSQPESPVAPARRAALAVLRHARDARAPGADALVEEHAARLKLDGRDTALAREIAFGVLRHRRWLEHVVERFVEKPFADSAPEAHEALLTGLFQLLYLDRVPPHAIVHETVALVSEAPRGIGLKGLTNAVLRRVAEAERRSLLPDGETDWRLAHSVPATCEALVEDVLPEEDERREFFAASNEPAPLCLRPSAKWTQDAAAFSCQLAREAGLEATEVLPGRLVHDCVRIEARGVHPGALPLFVKGLAAIEDEGAQAALLLALGDLRPRRILDLCAAPGGKTAHLCDLFPKAEITACDVSERKRDKMRDTLRRLGHQERVRVTDSRALLSGQEKSELFDFVLVDAPCSGLGTLRRHPEARYRRTHEDVAALAGVQERLLADAARLLAPGGVLAFSVCTVTRSEGEQQAVRFLMAHPEFDVAPIEETPGGVNADLGALEVSPGLWRLWPHRHGCDGFTIARFARRELAS